MTADEKISLMYKQVLHHINRPHLNLREIAEKILTFFIDIFGADLAELAIIRDDFDMENMPFSDEDVLKCRIIYGYTDEQWKVLKESGVLERSLRYCLREKKAVVVPDTEREDSEDTRLSKFLGTGSWMNNVLLVDNRVVAKIHLSKREKYHYDEKNLEKLKELSLLLATAINISNLWERERELVIDFIGSLNRVLELKDKCTAGHVERVKGYSVALAQTLDLPYDEIELIEVAAILHDIGKIGISDEILKKPDKLSADEFEIIKQHIPLTDHILENIDYLDDARRIAVLHHEHYDGSGYVMGIRGEDLPVGSRIIGIADAFDAITSDRPYRNAFYVEEAIEILEAPDLRHWDHELVKTFVDYLHSRDFYDFAIKTGLIVFRDGENKIYDRAASPLKFRNFSYFFFTERPMKKLRSFLTGDRIISKIDSKIGGI